MLEPALTLHASHPAVQMTACHRHRRLQRMAKLWVLLQVRCGLLGCAFPCPADEPVARPCHASRSAVWLARLHGVKLPTTPTCNLAEAERLPC